MQIALQLSGAAKEIGMALGLAGLAQLALAIEARCDPYASIWASAQKSSVRLIAAEDDGPRGFYRAGVEIRLDPGAITYWRSPGDAGAPPVFSFEASENVADVAILYPAPTRIDEAGTEAFGYVGEVTFPLHVTPKDASRPTVLALTLRYAVCERLCLPATTEASLSLPPLKETAAKAARLAALAPEAVVESRAREAVLAAAEADVPAQLAGAERDAKVAIERIGDAPSPSWLLAVRGEDAKDLFAEAPEGWYFETRKSDRPNKFLIVEIERPKAESAAVPVILTLTGSDRSYEFAVELDRSAAKP